MFDFFFIPTIPMQKSYSACCYNCGASYPLAMLENMKEEDLKIDTPWWGFSGLILIGIFIGYILLIDTYTKFNTRQYVESPKVGDIVIVKHQDTKEYPYTFAFVSNVKGQSVYLHCSEYNYSSKNLQRVLLKKKSCSI